MFDTYLKWRFLNLNCVSMIPVVFTRVRRTSCVLEIMARNHHISFHSEVLKLIWTGIISSIIFIWSILSSNFCDLLSGSVVGGGDSVECIEVILGAVVQLVLPRPGIVFAFVLVIVYASFSWYHRYLRKQAWTPESLHSLFMIIPSSYDSFPSSPGAEAIEKNCRASSCKKKCHVNI